MRLKSKRFSRLQFFSLVLCVLACRTARAAEVELGKYQFRVADGFSVELVAAPPLVKYPICADFDEQGRLYVCESSGSIDWNKPQLLESMHRVLRLEDTDRDGKFDRRTVFAQFEMMPEGSMWLNGSLYVAAPPIIWKLTDNDDDGIADKREEWVKTDTVTGCLNDLRGPYLGPDGFVYWSKGPALQAYTVDGKAWSSSARHIMRRHPNGKDSEPLMVGGMDNPIEIAFTLGGQRMITCTYIQPPGQPRDDGILHAIYGAVYPKDIAPIYEFPWTGPDLMSAMTSWGAMSPAGLMCYQSSAFGDDYRGNLFSALFSGHKVLRHVLKPKGSTFECTNEELLGCDNIEFHPTEVMEDADGSLLVIETGGWYRNCCPSATYYRPDVDGAIYRIRRTDAKAIDDPRGTQIQWKALTNEEVAMQLQDRRPVVRRRAMEQLLSHGASVLPLIDLILSNNASSSEAKLEAVWGLVRMNHSRSLPLLRKAMHDTQVDVRQAAMSGISLFRDHDSFSSLCLILKNGDLHDQRLSAEALGRIRDRNAIPVLLEAIEKECDRSLEHALIYAMIEIGDAPSLEVGVKSKNLRVRRAAMIAIDQMPGQKLEAKSVLAELDSVDSRLQEAAWWIVSRHPKEWGGMMSDHLRKRLVDSAGSQEKSNLLRSRLARLSRSPELAQWIVAELNASGVSSTTQMLLLKAMGDAGGQYVELSWIEGLLKTLRESGRDPALVSEVIGTLAKLPPIRTNSPEAKKLSAQMNNDLLTSAQDTTVLPATRLRALASIKGPMEKIDDDLLDFVITQLAPEQPFEIRGNAAETISRTQLSERQLLRLASNLKNLALLELNTVLTSFQGSKNDEVGLRLISSLQASAAASSLNAFRLRSLINSLSTPAQKSAETLIERLEKSQAEQLAKAERVATLLAKADPQHGLQIFSSQKTACTACHKAANVGGITGPHLKGIGSRRSERDLIESILFPNASLVQSYESWIVRTDNSQIFNGVLVEDRPDEIVLSGGVEKIFRIPRSSIEEMVRSDQSIMPTGLDKLITDQEMADLVVYLKSL